MQAVWWFYHRLSSQFHLNRVELAKLGVHSATHLDTCFLKTKHRKYMKIIENPSVSVPNRVPLRPTPRDLLDRGRPSLFSAAPWQERLAKLETELEAMKLKLAEAGPETCRFQLVNGHECDLPARFQLLSHPASLDFRWCSMVLMVFKQ